MGANMHNTLEFYKLHDLGNDCVISWQYPQILINQAPNLLPLLSDRRSGIGFDQLILVKQIDQSSFFCRIFNADGSEAEQCGNGMRCVARIIHEQGLVNREKFKLVTIARTVEVILTDYEHIQINMGVPADICLGLSIVVDDVQFNITAVSLGNPHGIYCVPSSLAKLEFSLEHWGKMLGQHEAFPRGANIGFMQILNRRYIKLITYERGVGLTLACGSNACAAVIAGIMEDKLDSIVTVEFPRGTLAVEWLPEQRELILTGSAKLIFSGKLFLVENKS